MPAPLVLASASPRRRAILEQIGVDFLVDAAEVDELAQGDPRELARENALLKARAVASRHPAACVLGADTVVVDNGRALGKPAGAEQARDFLWSLSGRTHAVVSGIALIEAGAERSALAQTLVRFRALEASDIEWYLSSGEWEDKAGGYAIQGRGAALVECIEGDYLNVVGLPLATLIGLLPHLIPLSESEAKSP